MKLLVPFPAAFLALLLCGAPLHAQQETDTVRHSPNLHTTHPDTAKGGTFSSIGFHLGFSTDPCDEGLPSILGVALGTNASLFQIDNVFYHLGVGAGSHLLLELGAGYRSTRAFQISGGIALVREAECDFSHNGSWTSPDDGMISPALYLSIGTSGTGFHVGVNVYAYLRELNYYNDVCYPPCHEQIHPVIVSAQAGYAW